MINAASGSQANIAGIFNHNYINGTTRASLNNTNVTSDKNVDVKAADYDNLGTFEIATAGGFVEDFGSASAGFIENGNTINCTIKADTSATVSSLDVTTKNKFDVKADNLSRAYKSTGADAVAVSDIAVGFTLDILNQKSTVSANVDNVNSKGKTLDITATNYTDTDTWLGLIGVGVGYTSLYKPGVGVAGSIGVNYFDGAAKVGIKDSTLEFDKLNAKATNTSNMNDGSASIQFLTV